MGDKCWICFQNNTSIVCNCTNGFQSAHYSCIIKYCKVFNRNKCRFCNAEFRIPIMMTILYTIINIICNTIDFISNALNFVLSGEILEYDLNRGIRWDDDNY